MNNEELTGHWSIYPDAGFNSNASTVWHFTGKYTVYLWVVASWIACNTNTSVTELSNSVVVVIWGRVLPHSIRKFEVSSSPRSGVWVAVNIDVSWRRGPPQNEAVVCNCSVPNVIASLYIHSTSYRNSKFTCLVIKQKCSYPSSSFPLYCFRYFHCHRLLCTCVLPHQSTAMWSWWLIEMSCFLQNSCYKSRTTDNWLIQWDGEHDRWELVMWQVDSMVDWADWNQMEGCRSHQWLLSGLKNRSIIMFQHIPHWYKHLYTNIPTEMLIVSAVRLLDIRWLFRSWGPTVAEQV